MDSKEGSVLLRVCFALMIRTLYWGYLFYQISEGSKISLSMERTWENGFKNFLPCKKTKVLSSSFSQQTFPSQNDSSSAFANDVLLDFPEPEVLLGTEAATL